MALHQGTPTASEGGMFPEGHWRYWVRDGEDREDGDVLLPEITVRVRVWDLASSEGDGDWTVGTLMGRSADGRFFVLDVQRFQHAPGGVLAKVKSTAVNDGYETHIIIEQSRSGDGAHVIDFYTKELPGYSVSPANAKGEKEVRATPYSVEQNKNNVYLWRHASYLGTWIKEHSQMDGKGKRPKHDDEIDTGAYGMKFLLGHGGSFIWDSSSIPPGWDSLTPEEQMELLAIRVAIGAA
jgi:predicted phage terminase large subunit-like protein